MADRFERLWDELWALNKEMTWVFVVASQWMKGTTLIGVLCRTAGHNPDLGPRKECPFCDRWNLHCVLRYSFSPLPSATIIHFKLCSPFISIFLRPPCHRMNWTPFAGHHKRLHRHRSYQCRTLRRPILCSPSTHKSAWEGQEKPTSNKGWNLPTQVVGIITHLSLFELLRAHARLPMK